MDKIDDTLKLKEKLENLRDELNRCVIKITKDASEDEHKRLLDISMKLDEVIVNYIRNSNK